MQMQRFHSQHVGFEKSAPIGNGVIGIRYAYFGFRSRPSNADGFEHVSGNG
jgi:hypothetical protein